MVVELPDLRAALQNDELTSFFQPLVELRTGKLMGFEVLTRWLHPTLGPILPENFITLAEENGLIGTLSQQVFRKAFFSARVLPAHLVLAINISSVQMRHVELPSQIRELAESADFPPDRLIIEITESALIDNLLIAQQIAKDLKAMGCRLALDDFGTGYSSLAHLQALPFDEIKIDRSFVSQMDQTRESRKIVAAIVGLGHSLGLTTIAEGIETEAQADTLLCLGCEIGQGWLYRRPVPAEQLMEIVALPSRLASPALAAFGDTWTVSSLEAQPMQRLAQLEAIYDGAPVGLCFLDRNLRYVSLNRKFADMNGASVASHLGNTFEAMNPKLFYNYEPFLLLALKGEALEGIEIARPAFLEGEPDRMSLASYQPAFDESDEVIGISIAMQDTTERKRTEDALRESDDHQRYLVELSHQVPWIMDADGNSLQVSSQWVPSLTVAKRSRRHLGWLDGLHSDDLAPTFRLMKESLQTGAPIDLKYRVLIDGEWKWMRSQGAARLGKSGEILRWYGTVENIDDREQME